MTHSANHSSHDSRGSHSSTTEAPSDSHRQSEILFLDDALIRMSILDAQNLVDEMLSTLSYSPSIRQGLHQIGVRLTYALLRAPLLDPEREQILALHRHHAHHLAQRLTHMHRDLQILSGSRV